MARPSLSNTHGSACLTVNKSELGGNQTLQSLGVGKVVLHVHNGSSQTECVLEEVIHVPAIRRNLISVSRLMDADWKIDSDRETIAISRSGYTMTAIRYAHLFYLEATTTGTPEVQISEEDAALQTLHELLAHVGKDKIKAFLAR